MSHSRAEASRIKASYFNVVLRSNADDRGMVAFRFLPRVQPGYRGRGACECMYTHTQELLRALQLKRLQHRDLIGLLIPVLVPGQSTVSHLCRCQCTKARTWAGMLSPGPKIVRLGSHSMISTLREINGNQ
jgi:hypothetical protein